MKSSTPHPASFYLERYHLPIIILISPPTVYEALSRYPSTARFFEILKKIQNCKFSLYPSTARIFSFISEIKYYFNFALLVIFNFQFSYFFSLYSTISSASWKVCFQKSIMTYGSCNQICYRSVVFAIRIWKDIKR